MILEETEGNDHEETSVGQKSQESSLNVKSTKPPAMKRYASQVILILFLWKALRGRELSKVRKLKYW